jgi:pilus assembly protein CpaE
VEADAGAPATASILIIAADFALHDLPGALRREGISSTLVETAAEAESYLAEHSGAVIAVLDAELPNNGAFAAYKLLHDEEAGDAVPTLMVVPPESYRTFLLDPLRGVNDDTVAKPVDVEELVLRIKVLMLRAGFRQSAAAGGAEGDDGGQKGHLAKLVTVFHAKGGVGASTVATNLAVGLARFHQLRTLIVDADLWFGDLGVLMNVASGRTLWDRWSGEDFESSELAKALVRHTSGAHVLLRPEDPAIVERLDGGAVGRAISAYRPKFDVIIVDAPPNLGEVTLQLLDLSEQVLLVTTPEITAGHNSARFLKIAEAIGYSDKIVPVLNRANSGLKLDMMEEHLGIKVQIALPSVGKLVVESANQGLPILSTADQESNEEFTRGLIKLVRLVAPLPASGEPASADQAEAASKARTSRTGLRFWK